MIKRLKKLSFSYSLNAKMLYVSLISIVVAVIMYLLVGEIGCLLVEKVYMSEENIAQRKAEIYSRLSTYVNDNGISGKDTAAMSRWARENDYVTILLYDSGNLHRRFSGEKAAVPESNSSYDLSKYGRLYPLKFSDGMYLVAIVDSSQSREYVVADITAIAAAGGSIVLVLLFYMNKLTKRIIDLSRAATTVSSGRHSVGRSILAIKWWRDVPTAGTSARMQWPMPFPRQDMIPMPKRCWALRRCRSS